MYANNFGSSLRLAHNSFPISDLRIVDNEFGCFTHLCDRRRRPAGIRERVLCARTAGKRAFRGRTSC